MFGLDYCFALSPTCGNLMHFCGLSLTKRNILFYMYILSVHYPGLSDIQGDSQNVLSAGSGIPRQTEGHSFGNHLISESVNVASSSVAEASLYSDLIHVVMAYVRYNLEQFSFMIVM
jgi:hypothetical protein